jgi:uncharacterized iron-regulated membrane protein
MAFNVVNRNLHHWASFIVAAPLLVMIVSGLFLQMKKQWTWVQPPERRGTGTAPDRARPHPRERPGRSRARRSDLIESIHDGSFFAGDWTKLGLFLPAGLTMLLLWMSGMWMVWVPFIAKRRRREKRRLGRAASALLLGSSLLSLS